MDDSWIEEQRELAKSFNPEGKKRGRKTTASKEVQENGYRHEDGTYALTDGLQPWHERVVDYMILNPNATITKIAHEFEKTPQWIGSLMKSHTFKAYYQERIKEHQLLVSASIIHKAQGVAVESLDKMAHVIKNRANLPLSDITGAAAMSLKALGYGLNDKGVNVNVNADGVMVGISIEARERAREEMRRLREINSKTVESTTGAHSYVTGALDVKATVEEIDYVPGSETSE